METRMNEMLERRRRLIKYTLKKERESAIGESDQTWLQEPNDNFETQYKAIINKKNSVVNRFSNV